MAQAALSVLALGIEDLGRSRRFYDSGFGWQPVFENDEILFYQLNGIVLGLWLAFWVYVIYVLHAITVPTGATDLSATISANLVAISSSFVALCIGTVAGQALSRRRNNTSVAAT